MRAATAATQPRLAPSAPHGWAQGLLLARCGRPLCCSACGFFGLLRVRASVCSPLCRATIFHTPLFSLSHGIPYVRRVRIPAGSARAGTSAMKHHTPPSFLVLLVILVGALDVVVLSAPPQNRRDEAIRTYLIAIDDAGDAYEIQKQDLFAPRRSIASINHSNPDITGCCRDGLLIQWGLPALRILLLAGVDKVLQIPCSTRVFVSHPHVTAHDARLS